MTNLDSILKSRDITLQTKVHLVKAMVFPVVMCGCENWTVKKAECQRIDAFELWCWRRLESPSGCKKSQPVHPKGNQSWIFIGRTDAEAETPILWPPAVKNWLIGKDPDAGKDWKREEKQMTEDEMVGWHHRCNGREFEWALGVGDGQGGLACCSPCHDSATELMLVPRLWQIFQETTWEWTHKQPGYQSLDVLSKVSPGWFSSPRSAIVMFVCLCVNSAYFLSCSLFNHH